MTFSGGFGGGGAFGGGSSQGAFGKPAGAFGAAPASPFGAPAASPSAFGASTTSSPFGTTTTQPNAFNAPGASPSPFGGTNASIRPQGSVFGGNGTIGGPGASQARTLYPGVLFPLLEISCAALAFKTQSLDFRSHQAIS